MKSPFYTNSNMRDIFWLGGCALFFTLVLFGFGISEIVIYTQGTAYTPNSTDCPLFPNITQVTATKKIWSQWHWTYEFEEFSGQIRQVCPSLQHDTGVYLDGALVSRSDGKIMSLVSLTYINECHGTKVYNMKTGSVWQAIINSNKIWVSFLLSDAEQDQPLAYVESTSFFNDNIDIKNAQGHIVANLKRKFLQIPRKWQMNRYDPYHPGADLRVLSIIAGTRSFSDTDSDGNDKTDVCNQYFYDLAYTLIAFLSVVLLSIFIHLLSFYYPQSQKADNNKITGDQIV